MYLKAMLLAATFALSTVANADIELRHIKPRRSRWPILDW